ncbi:hypothetical protein GPECTOR_447g339 [Gonium pectorale]|uniref:Transaldolase n=1 Tax=Gonium pectorale TaxID=33097 RepID=A0A150FV24_GONPE|nr:hypothetical protein GPECTOR_447g339 [Gonium pectorale]|eukprot:KXZ41471.1 hypothetical protein GPECTOR_447g339 [Gonium pectorale]
MGDPRVAGNGEGEDEGEDEGKDEGKDEGEDEAALVAKVRSLASLFAALRVPSNRVVFGLPATWAATQAVRTLEGEGIATDVYMVYSLAQGIAAMQAGASVIRINVGRIHDWYDKNPGAIRNPHWEPLTEATWRAALGPAAADLLAANLKRRAADMDELNKLLAARISASD